MDRPISPKSGSIDLTAQDGFDLGGGHVDPQALEYKVAAETFRLQPQTLKVLVALHDKSGQAVTRDELIERCWNGRIVGDDVINRCISLLRPLASASGRFTIETIPRSGYRLIDQQTGRRRPIYWAIAGLLLVLVAIIGAALVFTPKPATLQRRPLVVLVMPFTAQPGGNAAKLAPDTQDSVVRMLAASGLSVKVPQGGRSADSDAPDLIVSGELSSDAQHSVATVRLEDPRRHAILLLRRLEASSADAADLPDRIGANLAAALSWTGPLILLDDQHPSDPAFIAQLLNHGSNPDFDGLDGFEFAQRNAPNAPDSAIAQLTFAMDTGLAIVDIPREQRAAAVAAALRAADRARQLAPDFGDVYIPECVLHSPTLIRTCEDTLRTGLAKDPQAPFTLLYLAEVMNNAGRTQDAASLAGASLAGDRYVIGKMGLVILLDDALGKPAAERAYKEAVRLWPNSSAFFWRRAEGLLQRGDFQALDRFEREVGKSNFPPDYNSAAAINQALSAHSESALAAACPKTAQGIQAIQCMIASNLLGDLDDAFLFAATLYPRLYARTPAQADAIWLDNPYQQDTVYLTSPATAAMRRDRRFLPLVDGLGLLDYWRGGRMPDFCTQDHEPVCSQIAVK
ncbi:MAG TPA: winged helix-turn-helix domain-containing protein [Sphingomicrobium sp.]|jgi:DNA-binding winged helix-turn-helix (wHTH) protein|nr:winged helix-turn-helix domain-containing protein [Sphingomicrobium sp.]